MMALMIPICALMIPIVAVLTSHQRKMAEIIHSRPIRNVETDNEIAALRGEVFELKQLVHQQTIALDNMVNPRMTPPTSTTVQERLGS